ncbi:MAG: MATE family efflux transporter [Saprospiraceae bacterium]|nr:MATE family efflux transporter [Saprospiraceae bacterium]
MTFTQNQKELLVLAWPIIMGQLSQMTINITDAIMVGRLGHVELASSSLMLSIISIPSFSIVGISYLIASLTATRRGQGKANQCASILYNCGTTTVLIALFISIILTILFPLIYKLGQQDIVINLGKEFFLWITWSIVPMVIFLSIKQFYDGLELTRIPMLLSTSSIFINIILNYILIYGCSNIKPMGLEGSGLASFITRTLICILLITHLLSNKLLLQYGIKNFKISWIEIKAFLKLALPTSWQYTSEVAAFSVLAIISGWYGSEQQASHQIAITIAAFTYVIFVGFSSASAIKIGEAYGKNNFQEIQNISKDAIKISFVMATTTLTILFITKYYIATLFNSNSEVIYITSNLLIFAAIFQYSDSLQALSVGMLRGIQDIRIPTLYTTISYWIIGLPAGYFLAEYFQWKVYGIWTGFILCLTISAVLLLYRFYKITRIKEKNLTTFLY